MFAHGFGVADPATGAPLTPESVFYVGSVAKQFTAACIALLSLDGALDLDAPTASILPQMRELAPISVRQLVHHMSGIRDYFDLFALHGWRLGDPLDNQMIVDLLARQRGLNFAPGSAYLYSNSNYILLAEIVRIVSGRSLRAFAHERLFAPLAMTRTRFSDDHREIDRDLAAGRVRGFVRNSPGAMEMRAEAFDMHGDGGMYSTVGDLLKWDENFYSGRVGGPALTALLLTQGVLVSGETLPYAFGLGRFIYRGARADSHSGAMNGFRAELMRFPEHHVSVAILANDAGVNPTALARAVADILIGDAFPAGAVIEAPLAGAVSEDAPVATAAAGRAEPAADGIYDSAELGVSYRLTTEAGAATLTGPVTTRFACVGADLYVGPFGTMSLERDDRGRVGGFTIATTRSLAVRFERRGPAETP